MNPDQGIVERMRRAFAADDRGPLPGGHCPEPGQLWDATHERLAAPAARRIVGHTMRCPSCAAEWRIALRGRTSARAASSEPFGQSRPVARSAVLRVALGAAAVVVLAVGGAMLFHDFDREPGQPVFRSGESVEIRSLVPEDQPLSRDHFVLRWSSAGDGAVYDIELARETLEPITFVRGIAATEYVVPPSALEAVAGGEPIVWRVQARLADGRSVTSGAFVNRLR